MNVCQKKKVNSKGSLELKPLTIVLVYAVVINFVFFLISDVENVCSDLNEFNINGTDPNPEGDYTKEASNYVKLLMNRCSGLPSWIFWIFQAPLIVLILYILLEFVPFFK